LSILVLVLLLSHAKDFVNNAVITLTLTMKCLNQPHIDSIHAHKVTVTVLEEIVVSSTKVMLKVATTMG